jgi:hypothetical protein
MRIYNVQIAFNFLHIMNPHFLNKRLSHLLGFAGLIPFVLLLLGTCLADPLWIAAFVRGQLAYGMVILSFLGGIHWGAAMLSADLSLKHTKQALIWGVIPSLIAWTATLLEGFGFALLMAGFIVAWQVDKALYKHYGMPEWLFTLRTLLTTAVVLLLAATVAGANLRG